MHVTVTRKVMAFSYTVLVETLNTAQSINQLQSGCHHFTLILHLLIFYTGLICSWALVTEDDG